MYPLYPRGGGGGGYTLQHLTVVVQFDLYPLFAEYSLFPQQLLRMSLSASYFVQQMQHTKSTKPSLPRPHNCCLCQIIIGLSCICPRHVADMTLSSLGKCRKMSVTCRDMSRDKDIGTQFWRCRDKDICNLGSCRLFNFLQLIISNYYRF